MTSRHHTVLATLLVLGGLYVMRLAHVEIQPYPEALHALRGLSIQNTMQWLDQAAAAPGGMYSAMMAPLPAWMIAVGIDVVGPTPLAVRWFAVLCTMITMLLTYALARRVVTFESSVMSMVIVGTSIPFIVFGRQADTLVPFVAAALTMVWSVVSRADVDTRGGAAVRMLTLALATAAGLLTAPIATLMVVIGLLLFLRVPGQRVWTLIGISVGLLLGLPWWAVMLSRYGDQVFLAWSLPHPTLADPSGGVLSPIAFLILASPILVVTALWVVSVIKHRDELLRRDKPEIILFGLWLVVGVFSIAFSQHRYMSQAVVLVPPASILAVLALERVRREAQSRMLLAMYILIAIAAIWYGAEHLVHGRLNLQTAMLGIAICMVAVVVLLQQVRGRSRQQGAAVRLYQPVVYGAIAIAALVALVSVVRPGPSTVVGGRQVARLMLDDTLFHKSFAYVFHNASETDAVNGQLEWYTQGWMSGSKPGYTHMSIALPSNESDEATLAIARLLPWVVYYHPQDRATLIQEVRQSLQTTHAAVFESRHYTLYKLR